VIICLGSIRWKFRVFLFSLFFSLFIAFLRPFPSTPEQVTEWNSRPETPRMVAFCNSCSITVPKYPGAITRGRVLLHVPYIFLVLASNRYLAERVQRKCYAWRDGPVFGECLFFFAHLSPHKLSPLTPPSWARTISPW